VFSGHQCAYVPRNVIACNHLVEQLPPTNMWGTDFYLGSLEERSKSTFRIVVKEPNTDLRINGEWLDVLNEKDFYESAEQDKDLFIQTSKPVLIVQMSHGYKSDSVGDPMMFLCRPARSFKKSYEIVTPVEGSWHHYINVSVPMDAIASFKIDGKAVDQAKFVPIEKSDYAMGKFMIDYGAHKVECNKPFGISSYGFGYGEDAFDAYGNM
jgi:hypothetical protein